MEKKKVEASFLVRIEKRFLDFMFPKFPKWVTPDTLTFLAFSAGFLIPFFYYLSRFNKLFLFAVSFLLVVHWFGDSHDGGLARYRKISRPRYGYYIDHLLDMITVFFVCFGLYIYGLGGLISFLMFAIYSILFVHFTLYCNVAGEVFSGQKEVRFSFLKFSPTESRIFIIILNLFLFLGFQKYAVIVLYLIIALVAIFMVYYVLNTAIKLDKEDSKKIKAK